MWYLHYYQNDTEHLAAADERQGKEMWRMFVAYCIEPPPYKGWLEGRKDEYYDHYRHPDKNPPNRKRVG